MFFSTTEFECLHTELFLICLRFLMLPSTDPGLWRCLCYGGLVPWLVLCLTEARGFQGLSYLPFSDNGHGNVQGEPENQLILLNIFLVLKGTDDAYIWINFVSVFFIILVFDFAKIMFFTWANSLLSSTEN